MTKPIKTSSYPIADYKSLLLIPVENGGDWVFLNVITFLLC